MTTAEARAYSIQEQLLLERIAAATAASVTALFNRSVRDGTLDEQALYYEYGLILSGAMLAASQVKVAYLQSFAAASNKAPFVVPSKALTPVAADVLAPDLSFEGAVDRAIGLRKKYLNDLLSNKITDAVTDAQRRFADVQSADMAAKRLGSLAESTVMSAADFVQNEVLGPDRRISALRRVVHPGACDRCVTVAQVLVFKRRAALRHDNCRCSFEPVFNDDPAYRLRLAKYVENSTARYRGQRFRGRQQIADAALREESFVIQNSWNELLKYEQQRLAGVVKTVKSNSYKDWAVMVSANQAGIGGGLLPVITRR